MPEHARLTRTRREFLCDACNGFGGLAVASMFYREELRAAALNPLAEHGSTCVVADRFVG